MENTMTTRRERVWCLYDEDRKLAMLTHSNIRTTQRYLRDALIRQELHKTVKDD